MHLLTARSAAPHAPAHPRRAGDRATAAARRALALAPCALALSAAALTGCASKPPKAAAPMAPMVNACEQGALATEAHLAVFDTLDFDVFSHQHWDRLRESHADGIVVHWPDGHQTTGLARHTADLAAMFVYAPDTRIEVHPVRFGGGEWTAVYGVMEGTFTAPMRTATGASIQPTGKHFKLPMATLGHWVDGVMDEEYLFWDNASYMSQLGIGG